MLDIPRELYTPFFAIARIVGWSAHRMEELITSNKILRPAYVNTLEEREYVALEDRARCRKNWCRIGPRNKIKHIWHMEDHVR